VRVSADRRSAHYAKWAQVLLYSRPEVLAVEADSEEGWVDVVDLSRASPGVALRDQPRKRIHGYVEIRLA
jgi:hypothetical protein